jgi:L,D-transpeptidase ErfK/SrfK
MKQFLMIVRYAAWLCLFQFANALTFPLSPTSDLVGRLQSTYVQSGESLGDIGRRFDVGLYEMIEANPKINPWSPRAGTRVTIPTQFILPSGLKKDLVLNLAEMRLYYYHPNQNLVTTYPIGIGRKGWKTPLGETKIISKQENPSWYPPDSIRAFHAEKGKTLPPVIPPGPENPLGRHAFKLSLPGYLIHGTNRPGGIGVRVTSGCIRLLPKDVEELYHLVPVGTTVRIIHEPYKLGWHNGQYYLEAHEPLSEAYYSDQSEQYFKNHLKTRIQSQWINWSSVRNIIQKTLGMPVPLSINP